MNRFILKVMYDDAEVISTTHAVQICAPLEKYDIMRSISGTPVLNPLPICDKYKIVIHTKQIPNISYLKIGGLYKIESIITFKTTKDILHEYVADSVKKKGDTVLYRPIFKAYLVKYHISNEWTLEFEET